MNTASAERKKAFTYQCSAVEIRHELVTEDAPVEVIGAGAVPLPRAALQQPHDELRRNLAHREQVLALHVGSILVLVPPRFERVDEQAPHVAKAHSSLSVTMYVD
jgi:hypothetical protein